MLIDVLWISGHLRQALQLTDEIVSFAIAQDERVYLPELLRIRGEQLVSSDPIAATRTIREAIELAHSCGAHSLEQRARKSLAALASRTTV
jgi:hypothetical protein